eukprot:3580370-Prymnesium_polylepis.1
MSPSGTIGTAPGEEPERSPLKSEPVSSFFAPVLKSLAPPPRPAAALMMSVRAVFALIVRALATNSCIAPRCARID